MNKIFFSKRFGFSLAEALITLLIVCLITLASIPVLTKKKRGMSNTGHGTYMCTAVSTIVENENGEQYTHQMVKNLIDDIIIHLENFKC